MPGLYLVALLLSAGGVAALDAHWRLAGWAAPVRTAVAVAVGTAFFLAWDLIGIAAGVFLEGHSTLLIGIDLAPQLPLEEPVFLAFLCYTALVTWAGAVRLQERRRTADAASRAVREETR